MRQDPAPQHPEAAHAGADAVRELQAHGLSWWRSWNHAAIAASSAEVPIAALVDWPDVAHWRGVAAFMAERADALDLLEFAWLGHEARGDRAGSAATVGAALVFCAIDVGTMERVSVWQSRTDAGANLAPADDLNGLWMRLGVLARVVLGAPDTPAAALQAAWCGAQLALLNAAWSPHERVLAALVLIQHRFVNQRFEQFDQLASQVEATALFAAASPLLRARWEWMLGYCHFHTGNHGAAESALRRALQTATDCASSGTQVQAALALTKLALAADRNEEAERLLDTVRPQWGAGRTVQLIQLQQMRARLAMRRGQPTRALESLQDARRLADDAALPIAEQGYVLADLAQVLIALDRADEASELLASLARECSGRDRQVSACLHALLGAWRAPALRESSRREALRAALASARQTRYMSFFGLLPQLAASVCALALRWGVEPHFVTEVIRSRRLPAPADADAAWPWPLWLGLFGGFTLLRDGRAPPAGGKTQHKPLELLRLLACERRLALPQGSAARALWPEADEDAAQRSLEMAVHRLRKLLGDATLVQVRDARVGLDATHVSSDVQQRRALVERVEALAVRAGLGGADRAAVQDECIGLIGRVIELAQGELLPGAPEAPWLAAERQRSRHDTVRAALAAAAVLERAEVGSTERQLLEAALRAEPLAEALVRRLMQAYQRAGQRGDALRVFDMHRRQLETLGSVPGPQLVAQWRELLAGD